MRKCSIELNSLVDYVKKKMDVPNADQLETHLAEGCESCQKQIQWLTRIGSALTSGDITHAPEYQINTAMSIFRERFKKPVQISWIARLIYDSLSNLQPVMARGERSSSRHRLYQTEKYEIDLWEDPISQQESYLIGQVIPTEGSGPVLWDTVQLSNSEGNEVTLTHEGSEFHAAIVPSGMYSLTILIDGNALKVENLTLGA